MTTGSDDGGGNGSTNADFDMRPDNDDDDDDVDDEELQDEDETSLPPTPPIRPPLKIKLRLPAHPSSAASTPARTPAPDDTSRPPSHRGLSRDLDIESEDDEDEGGPSRSTPSTSVTGRPMTTRQAVLASVVDSTHVSLFETSRKKKTLNDAELALRREETARKRKNMSEKKLEDEKAETINRLLKKQSRPKNKRSNLEDRSPHPSTASTKAASTPVPQSLLREALVHAITEREGEEDMEVDKDTEMADPAAGAEPQTTEVVSTMYRWVSSARTSLTEDEGVVRSMSLTFSVPVGAMGQVPGEDAVPVDRKEKAPAPLCDVNGCTQARKYKLVKDWRRGACGMSHLKLLA